MAINVPAIALARGVVAPDNREVLWEDTSNMNLPFYERVKSYDSNSTQWRMVTQFPLELLNELRKVDGDGSGLDANFLQGRTVNDIIQLAKDGSFTLPNGFIFIGNTLGNAVARAVSGDATLNNIGTLSLIASGVTAGTYDLATVTVDAKGRVTSASSYTITVDDIPELPQSKITGLVTDLGNRELLANKENSVINTSTTKYPTVNLLKIGLDTKEPTITAGTTGQYYRGDKTFQTLDKTAVGLGNVDNTSDANKPISSATQTALDTKEPTITAGTTGQYYRGDKTFQTLDKTTVGLDNVDNTSDANKPISTATQTALDLITDINWLGDYNNGYTYAVGDGVMFNGASFRMIAAIGAAGYTPSAYPANWLQITEYYNIIQDTTPQLGGNLDLNGNDINGTGNVDVTGNVIADVVQLRGGTGTQGEVSWSADEETIKLIMDGTTLYMGQDTFVHVRNNTASIITKGTAVYATGTLGASGRITVAPMIANGTIAGRLFIGLAAENIAIGADGQICSYGKIRQINTNAYNDGDVLWLSPTVAGQLTATEPTAPNLKIATAFVIHAANNGTLMVRAEQGTDLHSDQRVQVSGLANNDVLTWNNANQRWQNVQPQGGGHEIYNGTDVTPLPERAGLRFTGYLEAVDDAVNDETIVDLSSTAITPTETTRFAENGSGNIDLKIQENKLLKGNAGGFAIELSFAQEGILGLDVNNEVKEFETVEIYNILRENAVTGNKQLALLDINGNSANVKAKFEISAIAVQNTTANAVTISIGTTAGATNVANAVVIGANALVKLPLGTTFFSTTSGQNLFISSGSWNSANINIHVTISKIWQ